MSSRYAPRILTGVLMVVVATGYAWNAHTLTPAAHGFAFLSGLATSERFLTTAALAVWLVAVVVTTARESRPLRLVRHGTRRALLSTPLWRLLIGYLWMSAVTLTAWVIFDLATGGGFATGAEAVATLGFALGAIAYVAVSFAIIYWVLLSAQMVTDSTRVVAGVAGGVWVIGEMSRSGWIAAPNPLNLPQYLTFTSVVDTPAVLARLFLGGCLIWAVSVAAAGWRDAGRPRPHLRVRHVATGVITLIAVVTVVRAPLPQPTPVRSRSCSSGPGRL